ncbi:MAG: YihA family ribosome biogenesis GTP-binding protein [Halomonadaceae bacterium]|nr:MAG: YihA family ribosome biogenesis GTP-binding protein [Halomonadaceae bacterium]
METQATNSAASTASIAFNSARFLTSAAALNQCPEDFGAEVAFAGRSNAGKSSALNTLTRNGKLARTSKTPGRTRLINFFTLSRSDCRLVDLPGYGYAKVSHSIQEEWRKHLDDYMSKRRSLRGLTLIMDIRHPLTDFDMMMIEWCEHRQLPMMILLTKADKLKKSPAQQQLQKVRTALKERPIVQQVTAFSSLKQTGLEEARSRISQWLVAGSPEAEQDAGDDSPA